MPRIDDELKSERVPKLSRRASGPKQQLHLLLTFAFALYPPPTIYASCPGLFLLGPEYLNLQETTIGDIAWRLSS